MAYNVSICCDRCGEDPFNFVNETVSYTKAEKLVKRHGWRVTKTGAWYCKECGAIVLGKPKRPGERK